MATSTESRTGFKSPLHEMAATTPTDFWNDSCALDELAYAIDNGAVGATSNPTIVGEVLARELDRRRARIAEIATRNPTWSEDEVTWRVVEELAIEAAELLQPVFEREGRLKGRISIQTDPRHYRNADALVAQALRFAQLAPN